MQLANGSRWPAVCLLLSTIVMAGGCGDDGPAIGEVTGTVTFAGQPVTEGIVSFESGTGFGISVPLESDGTFELVSQYGTGIPVGSYRVSVTPSPPPVDPSQPAGGTSGPPLDPENIPRKYRSFETSDLTAEVAAEGSTFSFELVP